MEEHRNPRVWLITGSSSGLGRSLAEAVLAQGDTAVVTARSVARVKDLEQQYPGKALALPLDVTHPEQVAAAVQAALASFFRIDVLANNAGYGVLGALEELSPAQMSRNLETNLMGPISTMRAVLPVMRQQRSGHIVNISAIAAFGNEMGFSIYGGAKAALEAVSESVASEVRPLGIRVTIVAPGPFRTDFIGRSIENASGQIDDYRGTSGKFASFLQKLDGRQPGDPAKAAQAIIRIVESAKPPFRFVLGAYAFDKMRKKLKSIGAEIDAWENVGLNTDY